MAEEKNLKNQIEIQGFLTQVLLSTEQNKKLEIKLKSSLRKFQLSMDIDDMMVEGQQPGSFTTWIKQQIIKPYVYRIPETIRYLCQKLEIQDDTEIKFFLTMQVPNQKSKKRQRQQFDSDFVPIDAENV